MTFANNLDPDEAPRNVGPHLRSKLFEAQIIYEQILGIEKMLLFLQFLKDKNQKYLHVFSIQRVNSAG